MIFDTKATSKWQVHFLEKLNKDNLNILLQTKGFLLAGSWKKKQAKQKYRKTRANFFFFTVFRAGSLPNSPLSGPPSRLERKLTMKAKELKDALQSCHTLKDESANMKKNLEEMQSTLEEKEKSLRNAEYERDLLEKERVLYDTQIKVRIDVAQQCAHLPALDIHWNS